MNKIYFMFLLIFLLSIHSCTHSDDKEKFVDVDNNNQDKSIEKNIQQKVKSCSDVEDSGKNLTKEQVMKKIRCQLNTDKDLNLVMEKPRFVIPVKDYKSKKYLCAEHEVAIGTKKIKGKYFFNEAGSFIGAQSLTVGENIKKANNDHQIWNHENNLKIDNYELESSEIDIVEVWDKVSSRINIDEIVEFDVYSFWNEKGDHRGMRHFLVIRIWGPNDPMGLRARYDIPKEEKFDKALDKIRIIYSVEDNKIIEVGNDL